MRPRVAFPRARISRPSLAGTCPLTTRISSGESRSRLRTGNTRAKAVWPMRCRVRGEKHSRPGSAHRGERSTSCKGRTRSLPHFFSSTTSLWLYLSVCTYVISVTGTANTFAEGYYRVRVRARARFSPGDRCERSFARPLCGEKKTRTR